ncbi:MAG: VWA domain-containing protein [Bacilli bacterium]|nr:VWA domain-containing protein [Bacilli bacterium]
MKSFPIIPIWLMAIISIGFIFLILKTKNKFKLVVRILIIVVIFIINLRIMTNNGSSSSYKSNYDVFLVVDNTISMVAEDYNGTSRRLDAVKKDLIYLLNELPSSEYCLITYDNKSYIRSPLTSDRDTIDVLIETMDVKMSYYASGSSITNFKSDLKKMLENSKKKDGHKRVVFIVSDGENNTDEKIQSLSDLESLVDDGAVLGYGTTKGGMMKEKKWSTSTEEEYIEDRSSSYPWPKAVSKIDETNLKNMASDLGIDYVHMDKQSNIDSVIRSIINNSDLTEGDDLEAYSDTYYPFAILLTILLLAELYLDKRELV